MALSFLIHISLVICALSLTANSASVDHALYENILPDLQAGSYYAAAPRSKCMGDLGCFENDADFYHILYRPINVLPADRESINVKFLLHTRKSSKQSYTVKAKDKKSIDASGFDAKRETKFIIHGYIDNQLYGEWMRKMKDQLLTHGDYNVIIVDWSGGNLLPYIQASSNCRVVGAEIALLVNYLQESYGLKPEMVHILGHSLGAHIAGYAGERIKNMGRITGMDPAEPFFQGLPSKVRIDQTDAKFVDIIHSDSKSILLFGLGMSDQVGHVDFFPNNGMDNPGCVRDRFTKIFQEGLFEGVRSFVACNHQRAVDFMTDSINDHECAPVSYVCPSYDVYLEGRCTSCGAKGEKCAIMGMRAIEYAPLKNDNNSTKFYFKTNDKAPFCLFSYHMTVTLQRNVGKDTSGSMTLKIKGSKKDETFSVRNSKVGLYPGSMYTAMVTTSKDLGEIEAAILEWKGPWSIFSKPEIYVDSVQIVPLNAYEKELREKSTRKYCGAKGKAIKSGDSFTFVAKDMC